MTLHTNAADFRMEAIDHVQVAAPSGCEEQARVFYGDLLGMDEIPKPPTLAGRGGVWFASGPVQVHVGVQKQFQPALKAHPAFRVRNLTSLRTHLRDHGVEVVEDDALPGFDRFYVSDPFGNRLEFLEPIVSCPAVP